MGVVAAPYILHLDWRYLCLAGREGQEQEEGHLVDDPRFHRAWRLDRLLDLGSDNRRLMEWPLIIV